MTRSNRARPVRNGGFTLVELLIVVAVLGLLMVGLAESLSYAVKGWQRQRSMTAVGDELEPIDRVLRDLLEAADAKSLKGDAAHLEFDGRLPSSVPPGLRDAHIELLIDDNRQLLLRYRRRVRDPKLDPHPALSSLVLVERVDTVSIAYRANGKDGAVWASAVEAGSPPAFIRLRIGFASDDPRHWPDFILPLLLR